MRQQDRSVATREIAVGGMTFTTSCAGPEDGFPLLLLHGFPHSRHTWARLLPRLAGAGFRAYAPDQRGYSPGARPRSVEAYSSDQLVSDVFGIADAVGAERFGLAGHDWGGQIAWLAATKSPKRVSALAVLSRPHPAAFAAALELDPQQADRSGHHKKFQDKGMAARLLERDAERLRLLLRLEMPAVMFDDAALSGARSMTEARLGEADVEAYVSTFDSEATLDAALNWYRASFKGKSVLAAGENEPTVVPTLSVWGDRDVAVGEEAALATRRFVSAPYRFAHVDGAGHFLCEQAEGRVAEEIISHFSLHTCAEQGEPPTAAQSGPLLPGIMDLHGRHRSTKAALISDDGAHSWGELALAMRKVAAGLHAHGIRRGDVVAVVAPNRLETIETYLGAMAAGAVVAPINLGLPDDAIVAQIRDCSAKALIASSDEAERLSRSGVARECPVRVSIGGGVDSWTDWRDFLAGVQGVALHAASGEDRCSILYSSGTTGVPKGIVHTHAARLEFARNSALSLEFGQDARVICTIGLYSNAMWGAALSALIVGGSVVIEPRFDLERFFAAVEARRVTHAFLVPTQIEAIVKFTEETGRKLESLRVVISAGSALPANVKAALLANFPVRLIEAYGLTEGFATILSHEDGLLRPASVGRPMLGSSIAIIDDDGCTAGFGEAGEIIGSSAWLMREYLNRPAETGEAIFVDGEGRRWLRTGDIGRLDQDGFLQILDRKKDMILSGGQNIYPADLEAKLSEHESVAHACVIAAPHEKWGETPLAVVVLKPGAYVSEEELKAWTNERVAKWQRVSEVRFTDELPRNAMGKVLKRHVRNEILKIEYDT